jgi:hypothetical protein
VERDEERCAAEARGGRVRRVPDRGFEPAYQQNAAALPLAVVVLRARSNDADVLRPLMPELRELLPDVEHGRLYHVPEVG